MALAALALVITFFATRFTSPLHDHSRAESEWQTRNIEDIRPGDVVVAYDFRACRLVERRVLGTFKATTHNLVHIRLPQGTIAATRLHPFWVENLRTWLDAFELEPGMRVRLADGRIEEVVHVAHETLLRPVFTYNLEVEGEHNYFVGFDGVLVHNGPPLDAEGYWNYYLKDAKGRIYYVGLARPGETLRGLERRHQNTYPGRFNPANGDTIHRVPGTRTYAEARRFEHEAIIRHGTYIGRDGDNYRGKRQRGIGPRNSTRYYPEGDYPECP